MRVLHVVPSLAATRGGPTAVLIGLVKAQLARGHSISILTTDDAMTAAARAATVAELSPAEVRFVGTIGPRRFELAPSLPLQLARMIARTNLVHVHTIFTFPVAAAALLGAASGIATIVRPAGTLDETCLRSRSPRLKRFAIASYVGAALRGATLVHATSALEHGDLTRHVTAAKLRVVEPGVDAAPAPADLGKRGARIASVGRLHPVKGLERLIDALPSLPTDVTLELGGDGPDDYRRALGERCVRLGVADRVRFLGHLDRAAYAALLARADVVCVPSTHESFGVSAVEAMMAGRALVATEEVGVTTALARVEGAPLVRVVPGHPAALATALRSLLDDGTERAAMAARAQAYARAVYAWPEAAARIDALYDEALRLRPRSIGVADGSAR